MCRLAFHIYKDHYACFTCRKMFRPAARQDLPDYGRPGPREPRLCSCPQCGQPMHDMGMNFKPPKQHDVQQWCKVEALHVHGYTWHDCGCGGRGPHVQSLKHVPAFLAERQHRAEEQERGRLNKMSADKKEAKKHRHHWRRKFAAVNWGCTKADA